MTYQSSQFAHLGSNLFFWQGAVAYCEVAAELIEVIDHCVAILKAERRLLIILLCPPAVHVLHQHIQATVQYLTGQTLHALWWNARFQITHHPIQAIQAGVDRRVRWGRNVKVNAEYFPQFDEDNVRSNVLGNCLTVLPYSFYIVVQHRVDWVPSVVLIIHATHDAFHQPLAAVRH